MKPLSHSQTGLRATAIAVPFVVLFILAAAAQAQGTNPPGQTSMPPAPATGAPAASTPVGHRQPTMNALPPAVRKDEETTNGNRARDDLGPMQSICSRC